MTARDLALEIHHGLFPMLRCEIEGETITIDTPHQRFIVSVKEDKGWKSPAASAGTASSVTSAPPQKS